MKPDQLLPTAVEWATSAYTPFILRHYANIILDSCRKKKTKNGGLDRRQLAGFFGKPFLLIESYSRSKRQTLPLGLSDRAMFIYNFTAESVNRNEVHF